MTIKNRLRNLEYRARVHRTPKAVKDLNDWELAAIIARDTGLKPHQVMAMTDEDLEALIGDPLDRESGSE